MNKEDFAYFTPLIIVVIIAIISIIVVFVRVPSQDSTPTPGTATGIAMIGTNH
jgi:hypothetical protein